MDIRMNMEQFKKNFEPLFQSAIEKIMQGQYSFGDLKTELDVPLMDYLKKYTQGGKRIRPFLIFYFSGQTLDNPDIQNICIASELFHLAALIHDDMMDQATVRRGAETLHIAADRHKKYNDHLGHDVALLLGDIFLTAAIQYAHKLPNTIHDSFTTMIQRTIRGQYLDSFGMNKEYGSLSEEEVYARHELKTAYYTFVSPGVIGNNLSENPLEEKILEQELKRLGILFQIRDDIVDCIDTNSGKRLYGDIFENQTTWVTLEMKKKHPELFEKLLTAKQNQDENLLKDIFEQFDLQSQYIELYKKHNEHIQSIQNVDLQEKISDVFALLAL